MRNGERYGLDNAQPTFSFNNVMSRVRKIIADIAPNDSVGRRYTELGVEVLKGYAQLIDPWTVEITLNEGGTPKTHRMLHCYRNWRAPVYTRLTGSGDGIM